MVVKFSGIFRVHGSNAMHWATQYAQAIQASNWQRPAGAAPVVYPWSTDDGATWQAVLLTGREAWDFGEIESASKFLSVNPTGNTRFVNQVQSGYAMSRQAIDVYA